MWGARMLHHVEQWAIREECRRLFLNTIPFLQAAIRLCETHGFCRVRGTHDLFGTQLFTMEKLVGSRDARSQ